MQQSLEHHPLPSRLTRGVCGWVLPHAEHSSPALLLEERAPPQTKGSWDEGG